VDTKDRKSRDQLPGMAGSKLETATRDLFRLNGGQSIPVEARVPAQPSVPARAASRPAPLPEPPASASGRKPEASIIFSLEALMKSAAPAPSRQPDKDEEIDQQLWNMQAETPLFGTAQDQALLTTPLEPPPRSSTVDSMTVSSRHPGGMRLVPVLLAIGAGCVVVLGGASWWATRPSSAQSASVAAKGLEAPLAEPVLAEPVLAAPVAVAAIAPAVPPTNSPSSGTLPAPSNDSPAAEAAVKDPDHKEAAEAAATPAEAEKPAPAEKEKEKPRSERVTSGRTPPRSSKPILAVPVKNVPFDMAAARDALNGASAKAEACTHAGAGGKGKIQLTFGNNGKVSSASIVDGPFAANTPAGKCALRQFHAAHVPAFTGAPVTVAKSFKIP
jgi:hypothetical protein